MQQNGCFIEKNLAMDCFCSRVLKKPSALFIRGFNVWIISFLLKVLQLSVEKARRSFGGEVLDIKLRCCHGQLSSFPMVTISSPTISRALLLMTTSETKELALETEPLARDNNTI